MLYHISFPVHDPERVASVLAELLDATFVACPSPPFPAGSKFVCCGDDRRSGRRRDRRARHVPRRGAAVPRDHRSVSLWLEGHQLVEFTTPELLPAYLATYGINGIDALDAKMRAVESQLTKILEDAAR